ncbi:MAG: hypothetical protein ACHQAY_20110 [Hyphomicrobiales bacterium]
MSSWSPGAPSSGRFLYLLSCLELGLVLGGSVGAVVTPQLLQAADDAGIYDFIRQSAALRAGAVPRSATLPKSAALRQMRAWPNMMHARLPAPGRHPVAAGKRVAPAEPEQAVCRSCDQARYTSPLEAILADMTLRAGDTIITKVGARVFRGAKRPPYSEADFMDFRESTLLTKAERRQIDSALGLTRRGEALQAFEDRLGAPQASLRPGKAQGTLLSSPQPLTRAIR